MELLSNVHDRSLDRPPPSTTSSFHASASLKVTRPLSCRLHGTFANSRLQATGFRKITGSACDPRCPNAAGYSNLERLYDNARLTSRRLWVALAWRAATRRNNSTRRPEIISNSQIRGKKKLTALANEMTVEKFGYRLPFDLQYTSLDRSVIRNSQGYVNSPTRIWIRYAAPRRHGTWFRRRLNARLATRQVVSAPRKWRV